MFPPQADKADNRAFTLIELLVVVAIISLLAAILMPALKNAKAAAEKTVCVNNLRQIGLAIQSYACDFGDRLPAASDTSNPPANNLYKFRVGSGPITTTYWGTLFENGYLPPRTKVLWCPAMIRKGVVKDAFNRYSTLSWSSWWANDGGWYEWTVGYMWSLHVANASYNGRGALKDLPYELFLWEAAARKGLSALAGDWASQGESLAAALPQTMTYARMYHHDNGFNILLSDGSVHWMNIQNCSGFVEANIRFGAQ
ncbi:MAG: prepilin-type N-terminal cleavage/methylation domain-containing protein [Verrucomicrobia bacterium]|nr:prepilin-type N-terminal cleavage/methylation domain-containing protein [Verrucomicrobiota bacterium]